MVTVLDEYTTEKQISLVRFLFANRLNSKDIYNEMFPIYGGKCLSRTAGHHWVANVSLMTEDVETEVRKWLRQQLKDFYSAGFNTLVKRWDKFIGVGGRYVEN
jgi:hypothetical protein